MLKEANELLAKGDLDSTISQVQEQLRNHPKDKHARTFLFELLCFKGDFDRADKQLELLGKESQDDLMATEAFRGILRAEKSRIDVFYGEAEPHFIGEKPAWAGAQFAAARDYFSGKFESALTNLNLAEKLRTEAEASAAVKASKFSVNGGEAGEIMDGDDFLSPFLEFIHNRQYCMAPWTQVKSIVSEGPSRLRDTFWMPARLELKNAALGDVLLPVLYPKSYEHEDASIRLGRATDWISQDVGESQLTSGVGQHLLYLGEKDFALLEVRQLESQE